MMKYAGLVICLLSLAAMACLYAYEDGVSGIPASAREGGMGFTIHVTLMTYWVIATLSAVIGGVMWVAILLSQGRKMLSSLCFLVASTSVIPVLVRWLKVIWWFLR